MIPIRNFPYTDYHDLNLDWLLRQLQIWEIDLDELKRRVKVLEDWRTDTVDPDLLTIKGDIVNIKGDIVNIKLDIIDLKNKIRLVNNWLLDLIKDLVIRPADASNPNLVAFVNGFGALTFDKVVEPLKDKAYVSPIGGNGSYTASKVLMYENNIYRSVTYKYDDLSKVVSFTADYGNYYKTVTLTKTGEGSGEFTVAVTTEAKKESIRLPGLHTDDSWINANCYGNPDASTSSEYEYCVDITGQTGVTADSIVTAVFGSLYQTIKYSDYIAPFVKTSTDTVTLFVKSGFSPALDPLDIEMFMVR